MLDLRFQQFFPQLPIHDAYLLVEHWLAAEKAKVKAATPPSYIEAAHGTKFQPVGWKRNAGKRIQVALAPHGPGTAVLVTFVPSPFYFPDIELMGAAQARANFGQIAEGLWRLLAAR